MGSKILLFKIFDPETRRKSGRRILKLREQIPRSLAYARDDFAVAKSWGRNFFPYKKFRFRARQRRARNLNARLLY